MQEGVLVSNYLSSVWISIEQPVMVSGFVQPVMVSGFVQPVMVSGFVQPVMVSGFVQPVMVSGFVYVFMGFVVVIDHVVKLYL